MNRYFFKISLITLVTGVTLYIGYQYFFGINQTCEDNLDTSAIQVSVKVVRLEDELFKLKNRDEIKVFLEKHSLFAQKFYNIGRVPEDTIVKDLERMISQPLIRDSLLIDVKKQFGDFKHIENQFIDAFKHIKFYFPDFKIPIIYTTITGLGAFGSDLYVGEEAIIISLDLFLNKPVRFRPPVELFPDYIWRRYHQQAIVPTCVQYISNKYNRTNFAEKTLLAEMIYGGKAYQFVKTMLPCLPDSLVLGYTQEELANISDKENRAYIWNHFIEKKLLFSNLQLHKNSYINERPYVAEINAKCPGRIGQWLGWRIVQQYQKNNPNKSFQDLMRNDDIQAIFNRSGYQGQ